MYRGLYNIVIKSIGAARKKDPATRLDYVIDFGERMTEAGFYFMDSPGNDLESIAGQVAAGCNMILFATGNGSITNFPFVPTIKVMTTTGRFELVRNEMDFNAGRYQEGEGLEDLGAEAFEQMVRISSGGRSAGERAGHSQVQLWREWRNKEPVLMQESADEGRARRELVEQAKEVCAIAMRPKVALVVPTSLCSGQIAAGIAERLNEQAGALGVQRAVALAHTEGCGNSIGESEHLFMRTMAGYVAHPYVTRALFLEHGCEKTHNDAFRNVLREVGLEAEDYAFCSVQLDGGIDRVTRKALAWFSEKRDVERGRGFFAVGIHGREMPWNVQAAMGMVAAAFLEAGAAVVRTVGGGEAIDYGARVQRPALYRMDCPTDDELEIVSGLGATGVEVILTYQVEGIAPGNPVVPTIRIGGNLEVDVKMGEEEVSEEMAERIIGLMQKVRLGKARLAADRLRDVGFQITRGTEGISL
jgi:altronate dehydratase